MLVLYETAMGYCLFKVTDSAKLESADLWKEFESPERASKLLKLKALHRFTSTASAVEDITALQNGKLGKGLKKFLSDEVVGKGKGKDHLVVVDTHLAHSISKKLGIKVNAITTESDQRDLWRGIREQLAALLDGLDPKDLATMSLGLSHSLSRFKLKFSPDKVDTMIVQAIALLDDLDKEINIYAMRVKEWYGWHFPELAKIVSDNLAYAKVLRTMAVVKAAAEISMGTEISDSDMAHIHSLCDQVISITAYRAQLYEYLRNRMNAIAPNLTALVGELVGARLISHAGSLLSLAKFPASTVQILGAEKALFRALKTKHDTPKYGLIYHASLIGQASPKLKGKMARMVATKSALAIRIDCGSIGVENRAKLESRLRALEEQSELGIVRRFGDQGKKAAGQRGGGANCREGGVGCEGGKEEGEGGEEVEEESREGKIKEEEEEEEEERMEVDGEEESKKKEKKRKRRESEANGEKEEKKTKKKEKEKAQTDGEIPKKKKKKSE
ncbi:Nop domain-containing protein [Amanita rubescens]|nr:Nop domain-containing protein [Amanita rubescens]